MRWLPFCLMLLPTPSLALDICDDLWFTRNLMFDRGGYCFGSALGKAVFDNTGCIPGAAEVDPSERDLLARVIAMEADWGCKVDNTRTTLNVPRLDLRKALVDLPLADGYESACVGWRGGPLDLRRAHHPDAPATGLALDGDMLLFQFLDEGGWSFVEVFRDSDMVDAGWVPAFDLGALCTDIAG